MAAAHAATRPPCTWVTAEEIADQKRVNAGAYASPFVLVRSKPHGLTAPARPDTGWASFTSRTVRFRLTDRSNARSSARACFRDLILPFRVFTPRSCRPIHMIGVTSGGATHPAIPLRRRCGGLLSLPTLASSSFRARRPGVGYTDWGTGRVNRTARGSTGNRRLTASCDTQYANSCGGTDARTNARRRRPSPRPGQSLRSPVAPADPPVSRTFTGGRWSRRIRIA